MGEGATTVATRPPPEKKITALFPKRQFEDDVGNVGRLRSLEDTPNVDAGLTVADGKARSNVRARLPSTHQFGRAPLADADLVPNQRFLLAGRGILL